MRVFETIQPQRPALTAPAFQARPPVDVAQAQAPQTARPNRFSVNRMAGSTPVWQPRDVGRAAFSPEAPTPETVTGTKQKPGFADLLDVINPLQHIPVVNMVYRKLTGDEISAPAQFMGGMIFGGPIGGAAALADVAFRQQTGKGFGDTMVSLVTGKDAATDAPTMVAQAAERWTPPARMAGAQPVWDADAPRPSMKPGAPFGRPLAPQTEFAILLNDLATTNPNIS